MIPVWRSLQYVPVHVEKYVASPHIRDADGVILDLEDSVPPEEKARARGLIETAAHMVGQAGADVLVRINDDPVLAAADIAAAVRPGIRALVLPKVRSAADLQELDRLTSLAEASNDLPSGSVRFVVLIESADGFLDMATIAKASPRVTALNLGNEDFALDLGMEPSDETLLMPRQQLVIAAAAARVMPLGLVGVATHYNDLDTYRVLARRSRKFGFVGATCIHPSQIAVLNEAFSPTNDEVTWARRVTEGAKAAQLAGRGAFAIDGKMIDAPIVSRAKNLLWRHDLIAMRSSNVSVAEK